jgi:signal transduction histidine kinase
MAADGREESGRSNEGRPRVLVVDDERVIRLALQSKLAERFAVSTVDSAEAALDAAAERAPDVMLVDKNLPGIDGIELLQRIKAEQPQIEVILITGYASMDSAVEALRAGAFDYLVKPLPDLAVVVDRVSRAAERKRLVQQRDALVERLRASEERLRLVFEQLTSGVLLTDGRGRVELANPAAAGILGVAGADALRGLVLDTAIAGAADLLEPTPAAERGQVWLELDGGRRPIGYATRWMCDGEHRITVFDDLSAVVESDRRRRRAEQLALVGEMAARLSHEIKNPLGAMLVGLRVLERGDLPAGERDDAIADLLRDAEKIDRSIRQLLDQARPLHFDPRPLELSSLLRDALRSYERYCANRDVALRSQPAPGPITAVLDPSWLQRVLDNLVLNAVDAAGAGGEVTVGWHSLDSALVRRRFGETITAVACLEVSDDGPGIAPQQRRRIFEPFWTTKASGTGLGLTVSLELVEDSGGLLEVDSATGRGTTFRLLLPAGERSGFDPHRSDCPSDCPARRSPPVGSGKGCWVESGRAVKAETGFWPAACRRCPVFCSANLGARQAGAPLSNEGN